MKKRCWFISDDVQVFIVFSFCHCRWSHSHSSWSDEWLCGPGSDRSLHREDDTVRNRDFRGLLLQVLLTWTLSVSVLLLELKLWRNLSLDLLCLLSPGRFFKLLHRETVVVNRWLTWSCYWHGLSAVQFPNNHEINTHVIVISVYYHLISLIHET